MGGQKLFSGKVVFAVSVKTRSGSYNPAVAIQLGSREKWIPNSPGVDRTGLECRSGVGQLQVRGLDVVEGHAGASQQLGDQMVRTGSFGERNGLTAEFAKIFDWRIFTDHNSRAFRAFVRGGDVNERYPRRLSKNHSGISGMTHINAAAAQGFQDRRTIRKLPPFDRVSE